MEIYVPGQPRHLKISAGMIEDLVCRPVVAAKAILDVDLDHFQELRLQAYWDHPYVYDSSGKGSGKTFEAFVFDQLRAILFSDQWVGVYFPTFQQGKSIYWDYYTRIKSPLFRAQMGYLGAEGEEAGKSRTKEPACWVCRYRNESKVEMPAPSILLESDTQKSRRFNTLDVQEVNTVLEMSQDALHVTLLGRVDRACRNKDHPIWGNHILLSATAEDMLHPAGEEYRSVLAQIRRGDPNVQYVTYSFKDFSDRPIPGTGGTFKGKYRNDIMLRMQRIQLQRRSLSKWLNEGLGIFAHSAMGWFSSAALGRCVERGREQGLLPVCRRADPERESRGDAGNAESGGALGFRLETGGKGAAETHYFLGVDPAISTGQRSDDGALAVLRARSRNQKAESRDPEEEAWQRPSDNLSDWELAMVYARIVRGQYARQWSGLIHKKHQDFGFSGICVDAGEAGGGMNIIHELGKTKQLVGDGQQEEELTPILPADALGVRGDFILTRYRRGGKVGIERLWPGERGDDTLKDRTYQVFKEAIDAGGLAWPAPFNERKRETTQDWDEEKMWASKTLHQMTDQLAGIRVLMAEEGKRFALTARGARQFRSRGKDDLASAGMYAYAGFLVWLRSWEQWLARGLEEGAGFAVW